MFFYLSYLSCIRFLPTDGLDNKYQDYVQIANTYKSPFRQCAAKAGKQKDKMVMVRKAVKQFSGDKSTGKEVSNTGGGSSSPKSQHPPIKQSASARQLGSTSSNDGMSPSQSIKRKKKKKKGLPIAATAAVLAAGRSDSLKVTSSSPNLAKLALARGSQ